MQAATILLPLHGFPQAPCISSRGGGYGPTTGSRPPPQEGGGRGCAGGERTRDRESPGRAGRLGGRRPVSPGPRLRDVGPVPGGRPARPGGRRAASRRVPRRDPCFLRGAADAAGPVRG